ncbi:glycosyltransferase family 2 protein [Megalodesulfovibrio paquesii]
MKTAVIVPMKNELTGLAALLTTLYAQLGPEDELVAVDAGSDDGTWEFVSCFAATHPQVRPVRAPGAFPGAARNAGIRATDAPLIAQCDGGNLPCPGWLDAIRAPILKGEADYVTGDSRIMPIWKTIFGRRIDLGSIYGAVTFRGPCIRSAAPPDTPRDAPSFIAHAAGGDSVCYRREIWERAGGFADWLRFGADPLFVRKVSQQTPRLAFAEEAVVLWQLGPGLGRVLERRVRGQRRSLRTWEMLLRNWPEVAKYLGLALLLVLSLFLPAARPLALALLFVLTALQAVKSFKTWCTRPHPQIEQADRAAQRIAVILCIPVLDMLGVLARMLGTLQALARRAETKDHWEDRVREYLNP